MLSFEIFGKSTLVGKHLKKYLEQQNWIYQAEPNAFFCLAEKNGSAKFNKEHPADIFIENTIDVLPALDYFKNDGTKFISLLSSCGYSDRLSSVPLMEATYLDYQPATAAQGYAKRNLLLGTIFYNLQYKTNYICVCPPTVFGPGDTYNENSKFVGSLIGKIVGAKRAKLKSIDLWGTPEHRREIMYVKDVAYYLGQIALSVNADDLILVPLINLADGYEVTIQELFNLICDIVNYKPTINW